MAADQQLVGDVEPCPGGVAGHDFNACGSGHPGELYPLRKFLGTAFSGLQRTGAHGSLLLRDYGKSLAHKRIARGSVGGGHR